MAMAVVGGGWWQRWKVVTRDRWQWWHVVEVVVVVVVVVVLTQPGAKGLTQRRVDHARITVHRGGRARVRCSMNAGLATITNCGTGGGIGGAAGAHRHSRVPMHAGLATIRDCGAKEAIGNRLVRFVP